MVRISEDLSALIRREESQVWCGDFNTLCRDDYTDLEWEEIVRIRRDNGRRQPATDVVNTIQDLGFTVILTL